MDELQSVLAELQTLRRKTDGDVYISDLDKIAKRHKKIHDLALDLWDSGLLSAQLLATRIIDPCKITEMLLDEWIHDLNEWGLCDAFSGSVVRPTGWAVTKCHEWVKSEPVFERRAAFSTMAQLAWQKNDHTDAVFLSFLPLIEDYAGDGRHYVKKAVNWALRDIGKRNTALRIEAQTIALRLQNSEDKTKQWVGKHRMQEIFL